MTALGGENFPAVVPLPTIYAMRAYDSTEGHYVFWYTKNIDSAGASYSGPGPLLDIVVSKMFSWY